MNVLNCGLVALALFLASSLFYLQPDLKGTKVSPAQKKKTIEKPLSDSPKAQTLSPMDYVMIADENLFHPERRIPPEKKDEAALPKPEFVLFGTLITSQTKVAYLEDKKAPVTTPGRGKRQTALHIGESLSGFTLKEISADKVIMKRGEETQIVLLNDTQNPKTREAGGPAGPHGQTPKGQVTVSPSPPAGQPAPPPFPGRPGAIPPGQTSPAPSGGPPAAGLFPQGPAPLGRSRSLPPMMP